jgi:hypothetical protein
MMEFRVTKLTGFNEWRVERREVVIAGTTLWTPVLTKDRLIEIHPTETEAKLTMAALAAQENNKRVRAAATWEPIA